LKRRATAGGTPHGGAGKTGRRRRESGGALITVMLAIDAPEPTQMPLVDGGLARMTVGDY
jgi:hypothetical protein